MIRLATSAAAMSGEIMPDAEIEKKMLELDAEIEERLRRQVAKRGISAEKIALEALQNYLDWIENLDEPDRDAVEAWGEYKRTGLHVTAAEADAWLAELEVGNDVEPPECHT